MIIHEISGSRLDGDYALKQAGARYENGVLRPEPEQIQAIAEQHERDQEDGSPARVRKIVTLLKLTAWQNPEA